ncbi:hypothetical protein JR316_0010006 [Psilocybe cubensis]|uniref:Uncharacterized protein n=1 Tax=Psilocybe cubensis TaxID=181762 RepID=A0ACB8GQY2_PSICU|nr:hypothetical protein JR316_0010006 [Psilocybe cubensis]KAH9477777.1 hypothetical protein JR316_0010006 [Psilocybe cubensis]
MDLPVPSSNEKSSDMSSSNAEGSTQPPKNENASDGKRTVEETVHQVATKTDPVVQQPSAHVEPTKAGLVPLSSHTSPPRRDNPYNFLWGEDNDPYFPVRTEFEVPTTGEPSGLVRTSSGLARTPSAAYSFVGEKSTNSVELDVPHTEAADVHTPVVTQDMQTLFAQQQREIRDALAKQSEKAPPLKARAVPAKVTPKHTPSQSTAALDVRESILERREREFDRREREIDRRERDLERRERELERRQREFDNDRGRWNTNGHNVPWQWQDAMKNFKDQITADLLAERKKAIEREASFEEKIIKKVNKVLEHERQLFGMMRMSENEVNEMVENSVGYLLHNDEDIADRVRFQSLLHLTQERLASEAGLTPPPGSDSFSLAWRLALGPSVVTEDRYKKALELLKDKVLQESTKKVMECKAAMEYAVEYTSHLRKDGPETGDISFSFGRIPRSDYMESVIRHASQDPGQLEALTILVDFVAPEI